MLTPWFWALAASAGLFAALYLPAIAHWSRALASPYAKADVHRRMAAATLDGLLILSCVVFWATTQSLLVLLAGAGYALLRDAVGGQSIGKFVYSLIVIRLDTGRPAGARSSVQRNIVWLIPGANVPAVFLEALTVVRDPKGARLGDRIALTQVVDGFGAREFVKMLREQLTAEALRSAQNTKPVEGPVHQHGSFDNSQAYPTEIATHNREDNHRCEHGQINRAW
jgi:RDD family